MTITFKSTVKQSGEEKIIEFTSTYEKSKYLDFDVYEFEEPQDKVMNRIEVSESAVNIFAGPTSINLKLDEMFRMQYQTGQNQFIALDTYMSMLDIKEDQIAFEYSLKQNNEVLGEFKIELTLKK